MPQPPSNFISPAIYDARMHAINDRLAHSSVSTRAKLICWLLILGSFALIIAGGVTIGTQPVSTTPPSRPSQPVSGNKPWWEDVQQKDDVVQVQPQFEKTSKAARDKTSTGIGLIIPGFAIFVAGAIGFGVTSYRARKRMVSELEGLCAQFNSEDAGRLSWHLLQWTERYLDVDSEQRLTNREDHKFAIEVYYAAPAPVILNPGVPVVGYISSQTQQYPPQFQPDPVRYPPPGPPDYHATHLAPSAPPKPY